MSVLIRPAKCGDGTSDDSLFARIARDIEAKGFSIQPGALPEKLTQSLWYHQSHMEKDDFKAAGIGRARAYLYDNGVRRDKICWITGGSLAGRQWLDWSAQLQLYLNHYLYLGLFSFESHFSHYAPGAFYRKHIDAFRGEANRLLSIVVYLNREWAANDGGELVLYRDKKDLQGVPILPTWGTIVVFLSKEFPHEVLPTNRDRYSVSGWYRLNS
jgi:SM-20-related protein